MRGRGFHKSLSNFGVTYDAAKPRLGTLRQIRWNNKIQNELSGENKKTALSKVSLPKFSWEKKDELSK